MNDKEAREIINNLINRPKSFDDLSDEAANEEIKYIMKILHQSPTVIDFEFRKSKGKTEPLTDRELLELIHVSSFHFYYRNFNAKIYKAVQILDKVATSDRICKMCGETIFPTDWSWAYAAKKALESNTDTEYQGDMDPSTW